MIREGINSGRFNIWNFKYGYCLYVDWDYVQNIDDSG